jgi:mannose-6-phosphate isomerase-like protein (cupin superfamily)
MSSATPGPSDLVLFDLDQGEGEGPLWGTASADLNATLLSWTPGGGVAEHVNEERDVLLVVIAGSGTLSCDGEEYALRPGIAVLVPKGRLRGIAAGSAGIRYLSVHLRRPGLEIRRARGKPR